MRGLRTRFRWCWSTLTSGKIHFWDLSRALTRSKVSVISFEAGYARPDAIWELSYIRVVVLKSIVVAFPLQRDSVFCSCKLVLKPQEILIRMKLRIVLDNRE